MVKSNWKKEVFITIILLIGVLFARYILNLLIVSVLVLIALVYMIRKSPKGDKTWKWFNILITIIIAGILSNQVVTPLFYPRVSEIKITPLAIWGIEPNNPTQAVHNYILFDVDYEIELPMDWRDEFHFSLRMPGKENYNDIIALITPFQENNPYYEVDFSEELKSDNFISREQLEGQIPITIKANAWEIKKINAHFIIREKIDLTFSNIGRSDPYWWTDATILPIQSRRGIVTDPHGSLIGYGIDQYGNYYRFYDWVIKSLTDLEIRGLRVPINENQILCDDSIRLDKEYDKFVSIDLEPKETRHMLMFSRVKDPEREIRDSHFIFNFTSETDCYGKWLKYKEIIE